MSLRLTVVVDGSGMSESQVGSIVHYDAPYENDNPPLSLPIDGSEVAQIIRGNAPDSLVSLISYEVYPQVIVLELAEEAATRCEPVESAAHLLKIGSLIAKKINGCVFADRISKVVSLERSFELIDTYDTDCRIARCRSLPRRRWWQFW